MRVNQTMIKIMITIIVLTAIALFLNWSNKSLVRTEYILKNEKLPEAFDGWRIIQVSDLQSGTFGEEQGKLLSGIEAANPNIIVITGDVVDRNHTDYEASKTAMKKMTQLAPVYYVNGNHELALPETEILEMYDWMEAQGIKILLDEGTMITGKNNQKINLLGLSEQSLYASKADTTKRTSDYDQRVIGEAMDRLTKDLQFGDFTMMLAHEPQYLNEYAGYGVDLVFSGHAHGGQIILPFTQGLYAPGQGVLPKLTSGVHLLKGTSMVISRGLGNSVFPFRLFNRPEIVAVTLKRNK